MAKIFYVASEHRGRTTVWAGTIGQLVNVFGYTLECGNSRNPKVNRHPKTIKALITALGKAVDATQGGCYERDYYYETTLANATANGWNIHEQND